MATNDLINNSEILERSLLQKILDITTSSSFQKKTTMFIGTNQDQTSSEA